MNKQIIIKWCKRVGIAIVSAVAMFFLYVLSLYVYEDYYIPHHIESLYQEGLENPNKAEDIVTELKDIEPYSYSNQYKYLQLINYYANKNELWAQILLEHYNEERGLTLNSRIPINKHIWGITLGKSTKQDVLNYFDSMDLMHLELENGSVTQVLEGFEFAGIFWNTVYCYFTNDKIYKIAFVYRSKGSSSDSFDKLRDMLATKYTLSKTFISKESHSYIFSIKDSNTLIEMEINSNMELILKYTDIEIKNKKLQQDLNSI